MRELERLAGINPETNATYLAHYTIRLEGNVGGFLQHVVENANGGVAADMTPSCALLWYEP